MLNQALLLKLNQEPQRKSLISHALLKRMRSQSFTLPQLAIILGQWYHPLHYFPTFLAKLISLSPDLEINSHISTILWQELGQGNIEMAHEVIFIETMKKIDLTEKQFVNVPALTTTQQLIQAYREAGSVDYLAALGFAFGTEAADLAMVSAIGCAIKNSTAIQNLEWVNIHAEQEPTHTACVSQSLLAKMSSEQTHIILQSAQRMWSLWISFFDGINEAVTQPEIMEV